MTIHGSKGLQAPVVVVTGLFSAGKADASMSVQDNTVVTAGLGRTHPTGKRRVTGGWFVGVHREMNKAQDKAGWKFSSLSAVRPPHLTGAYGNKAAFNETTELLSVRFIDERWDACSSKGCEGRHGIHKRQHHGFPQTKSKGHAAALSSTPPRRRSTQHRFWTGRWEETALLVCASTTILRVSTRSQRNPRSNVSGRYPRILRA